MENFLIPAAVMLMMYLLLKASKKKPKVDASGNLILKLPKFYFLLGVLIILVGFGFLLFALFWAKPGEGLISSGCGIVALITGWFLYAKGNISNIRVTEEELVETTLFGKEIRILWHEITDVSFGKISLELKIKSPEKQIKMHMHLVGFPTFVSLLESKTGYSKAALGIPN